MKRLYTILLSILLAASVACSYPIKDAGDGVYYASSPPIYTYVDGYFGFPYYGPYSWAWYHPVWYSPYNCNHYSWYRSRNRWSEPFDGPAGGVAYNTAPRPDKLHVYNSRQKTKEFRAILPVDVGQMTISSGARSSSSKAQVYRSARAKSRTASKSSKSAYSRSSSSSTAYRPSTPSRSSTPVRSSTPRSVSTNDQ